MTLKNSFKSFKAAWLGLKFAFASEQNFRIQVFFAVAVIFLSVYLNLKSWELILIILLVTAVLAMELLNTALEYFADLLKPRLNQQVKIVKDLMAAAVFVVAITAMIIGVLIFWPHLV